MGCAFLVAGLLALTLAGPAAGADAPADSALSARVIEPRAYGWQVGDLVRRVVIVELPTGWQLDERSLPKPDQRGGMVELRRLQVRAADSANAADVDSTTEAPAQDLAEANELGRQAGTPREVRWTATLTQAWTRLLDRIRGRASWPDASADAGTRPPPPGATAEAANAATDDGAGGPRSVRGARRLVLTLDYQLFAAPATPRAIDLPTLVLLFDPPSGAVLTAPASATRGKVAEGTGTADASVPTVAASASASNDVVPSLAAAGPVRELRVAARPLWVSPIVGGLASNQAGLGELRPDVGTPGLDVAAPAMRLLQIGAVLAGLWAVVAASAALLRVFGVRGRARPFALAERQVMRALRRAPAAGSVGTAVADQGDHSIAALQAVQQACHQAAGRVLLAREVADWARQSPAYAGWAEDLAWCCGCVDDALYAATRQGGFDAPMTAPMNAPGKASMNVPIGAPTGASSTAASTASTGAIVPHGPTLDAARLRRLAQGLARAEARLQAGAIGAGT